MSMFERLKPYFIIKGLLLAMIYITLAVFFVFFMPRNVPAESELESVRISAQFIDLAYNEGANTSYFTGEYNGSELRSVTLTYESGLELYGVNEFFMEIKPRPSFYTLRIARDTTLFGERYTIYELADDNEVIIPYEFSAEVEQAQRNKFFYFGLAILALIGFILIRTLIKNLSADSSGAEEQIEPNETDREEPDSPPDFAAMQVDIVQRVVADVTIPWDTIEIHFEHYTYMNNRHELGKFHSIKDGKKSLLRTSLETQDAFIALQEAMGSGDREPWTYCLLNIDSTGKYDFEFKYGMPPILEDQLRRAGDL